MLRIGQLVPPEPQGAGRRRDAGHVWWSGAKPGDCDGLDLEKVRTRQGTLGTWQRHGLELGVLSLSRARAGCFREFKGPHCSELPLSLCRRN